MSCSFEHFCHWHESVVSWIKNVTRVNPCVLLCFIDPRVGKIRNEASSCPGVFSSIFYFECVASGGALVPTDSYILFFLAFILASPFFLYFFHRWQGFNFFFWDCRRFILAIPGSVHPNWPVFCEIRRVPAKTLSSDKVCPKFVRSQISGRGDVWSHKKGKNSQ